MPRIAKAAMSNLVAGGIRGGGSTITQQLIKKTYFPNAEKTYTRKFSEIILAIQADKALSKEEILTLYLNKIYFGRSTRSIGISSASRYYFNKDVSELTLPEAAMLAGSLNSPYNYDPYYCLNNATKRRNTILNLMVKHGYITQKECDDAKNVKIENMLCSSKITNSSVNAAYVDIVTDEVKKRTGLDPLKTQMNIYTYCNSETQALAAAIGNGEKYDYLTHLALECANKTQEPSFISAKKMRENYSGNVFSPMGFRSFLTPWKDENGTYKFEGRFNQGIVSINLPQIAIVADGDEDKFFSLLDERLELCHEALLCRHYALLGTVSDTSPIHWIYGAIAHLKSGEKIDKYLKDGYSTISLGYVGVYEATMMMKEVSNTESNGKEFAIKIVKHLKETVEKWKKASGLGFCLYGETSQKVCKTFERIDKERFGVIKNVTDKEKYTSSYHASEDEKIDYKEKLAFESVFQKLSLGGVVSQIPSEYIGELSDKEEFIKFVYDNVQYLEFTKELKK